MSKQQSLLNFFTKVPSPVVRESSKDNQTSVDTTKETPKKVRVKNVKQINAELQICDLLWAKLDGYPWWPSLVCQDPKSKKYMKGDKIHVQFFDNPPSRSWISISRCIEKYSIDSSKRNPKGCTDQELRDLKDACEAADKALKSLLDERKELLVDFNNVIDSEKELSDVGSSPGTDKENDDSIGPPSKKKKAFVFDSDDSEDDFKPEEVEESEDEDEEGEGEDEDLESSGGNTEDTEEVSEDEEKPQKNGKRKRRPAAATSSKKSRTGFTTPTTNTKPNFSTPSSGVKARLSLFKNTPGGTPKETPDEKGNEWPHLSLPFLQPDKIMDKERRRPDHPNYDPRTLYIPDDFKSKTTPGHRQWWDLKADHFDCVLFFKVGKFYELYHMDAVIGVNELSLTYMKGEYAHSGFPEIAYGRFSTILVQKGYKVARIEQTETPDMMNERCRQQGRSSKFDKVVNREICQVTTKGTQIFSFIDGEAKESETNYLLALTETNDKNNSSTYGVCFIDASIGVFHIGQFTDDKYSSRLRTLLSHYPAIQIIYERNHLSPKTVQIFKTSLASIQQECLAPEIEFWSATKTLTFLAEERYFVEGDGSNTVWPEAIKSFISETDSLGLSPSDNGELAMKAFGACIWYLKQSFLEQQLLAMKKFEIYTPIDSNSISQEKEITSDNFGRYMVLDGITLSNLEILVNSNGGKAGTLLDKVDRCCTFSGKRLLRQWLCSPLCSVSAIKSRQQAVSELLEKGHVVEEIRALFKKIPDLERLLGKIHTQGNLKRSQTHPDSRAIFFEDKIYSKRKILDFLSTLTAFQQLQSAVEKFQSEGSPQSKLLQKCFCFKPEGDFPNLSEPLKFFEDAFDHDLAKKEGCIIPKSKGVDNEYDNAIEELKRIEQEAKDYLRSQSQYFGVTIKYFGSDKNRYQLEIPESQVKKTKSEYEFTTSRKGFKRFTTPKTKSLLQRQMQAEDTKSNVLKDLSRRVFEQFSKKYEEWQTAIQCMSVLDVLMSIAEYCRTEEGEMSVPEFETANSNVKPFVDIRNGRHPCISVADGYIPNDNILGTDSFASLILLTGPNMGGKSTLMRQLGLIVILGHAGSLVPASSCKLTVVDRIFTRIGANDDILSGESTFFVELNETSLLLNHATKHSVVLIDELGRGTSTYDGTAIAYSVVKELSEKLCRTLFSTHYHTLVEDFKDSEAISLGHMACMVETDEDDPSEETVTFLYKFSHGACPKSHGFNAAKLAGVPSQIIKVGRDKADLLEKEGERRKLFRKLCGVEACESEELAQIVCKIQLVL